MLLVATHAEADLRAMARRVQAEQPLQEGAARLLAPDARADQQGVVALQMFEQLVGGGLAQHTPIGLWQRPERYLGDAAGPAKRAATGRQRHQAGADAGRA